MKKPNTLLIVGILGAAAICAAFALIAFREPAPESIPPNGGDPERAANNGLSGGFGFEPL